MTWQGAPSAVLRNGENAVTSKPSSPAAVQPPMPSTLVPSSPLAVEAFEPCCTAFNIVAVPLPNR